MTQQTETVDEVIAAARIMTEDHEPDGWPAIRMWQVTVLVNEIDELRAAHRYIIQVAEAAKEPCGDDTESPVAIRNGKFATIAQAAAIALGMVRGPSFSKPQSSAISDVLAERRKHVELGFTAEHDDIYVDGELAMAAACYAITDKSRAELSAEGLDIFIWTYESKGRRRDLVRATALLIAEIERLDRAAAKESQHGA